ncbi:hypothetical protein BO86DRAFT_114235 [Aspergillus japonicus CBS 114.51]|uniref:Uncharacterized protein n=1 Tax=Aspergillus japonicus CBS 114.51 TaxID=1448312 RepID=A0A8T8XE40_ASPJA|nr:hypothetical protein BO86DRAFT_114235 [Aspergillus japonicus CBS 114.51]RAH86563.1 hypothetical protein BO86DRAFT_114235 [Aspergillus japonicus CBS 114.51]
MFPYSFFSLAFPLFPPNGRGFLWLDDRPGLQEASWSRCDMHGAEISRQEEIIGSVRVRFSPRSQSLKDCNFWVQSQSLVEDGCRAGCARGMRRESHSNLEQGVGGGGSRVKSQRLKTRLGREGRCISSQG